MVQAVVIRDRNLMTSPGDVVWRWKEHLEDLLNPEDMPSCQAELDDSGEPWPIFLAEVS